MRERRIKKAASCMLGALMLFSIFPFVEGLEEGSITQTRAFCIPYFWNVFPFTLCCGCLDGNFCSLWNCGLLVCGNAFSGCNLGCLGPWFNPCSCSNIGLLLSAVCNPFSCFNLGVTLSTICNPFSCITVELFEGGWCNPFSFFDFGVSSAYCSPFSFLNLGYIVSMFNPFSCINAGVFSAHCSPFSCFNFGLCYGAIGNWFSGINCGFLGAWANCFSGIDLQSYFNSWSCLPLLSCCNWCPPATLLINYTLILILQVKTLALKLHRAL